MYLKFVFVCVIVCVFVFLVSIFIKKKSKIVVHYYNNFFDQAINLYTVIFYGDVN
jgi:hypothetical protein